MDWKAWSWGNGTLVSGNFYAQDYAQGNFFGKLRTTGK